MMRARTIGKNEPAAHEWTTQGLGWSALRESAQPIGWPGYLIVVAVMILLSFYQDSLQLTQALQLALTPLTVLLAIGSLPLLRQLVTMGISDTLESAEAIPASAPKTVGEVATSVSGSLAILASLNIFFILLYVALPQGELRDTLGILSAAWLFALVIFAVRIPALIRWQKEFGVGDREPDSRVPSTGGKHAWVIDFVICIVIVGLVPVVWGTMSSVSTTNRIQSSPVAFWAATVAPCYLYQLLSVGIWGRTVGQRAALIRVVRAANGRRVGWSRASLRILLPMAPVYLFYLLLLLGSSDSTRSEVPFLSFALGATAVVFMLSIMLSILSNILVRNLHPRGQGVLDLIMRTVSVREEVSRRYQSKTLSDS